METLPQHYNPRPRLETVKEVHAFVDGSYCQGKSGYGAVILTRERGKHKERNSQTYLYGGFKLSDHPELQGLSQMAAELNSCLEALEYARKVGAHLVTIHYDCNAIAFWAEEENLPRARAKANRVYEAYNLYLQECRRDMQVNFCKVSAHTGHALNDKADALARMGRSHSETQISKHNPIPFKVMEESRLRSLPSFQASKRARRRNKKAYKHAA